MIQRKGWVKWSGPTHFEAGGELPYVFATLQLTDAGEIAVCRYQCKVRDKKLKLGLLKP